MRVQHGRVERGDEEVEVREHDGHGPVDDAVGAVDEALGLVRVARRRGREGQRGVPACLIGSALGWGR